MGKFIVIILDSFGVGEMDDVEEVRSQDKGSNTALHIIKNYPSVKIPHLLKIGLMNSIGEEWNNFTFFEKANFGTSDLSHQGADSFLGHQEIMGTIPPIPFNEPFSASIDRVKNHLENKGYFVEKVGKKNEPNILVIDDCVTVGDNLETDLGQVYNVSGCLDKISFKNLTELGKAVREVVEVSRVITFGGENIGLNDLLGAKKVIDNTFAGVDAPESGVYEEGYQVIHLGYGINPDVQIPTILSKQGIDVSLIGKVADIVQSPSKNLFPGVDSNYLFDQLLEQAAQIEHGFICLNIQETDLAGHGEDVKKYANRLEVSDSYIGQVIERLNEDDILIVMADHGNDPTIGHSKHTREKVPLLICKKNLTGKIIGHRTTMSDIAATASEYFNVERPTNGSSFLNKLVE